MIIDTMALGPHDGTHHRWALVLHHMSPAAARQMHRRAGELREQSPERLPRRARESIEQGRLQTESCCRRRSRQHRSHRVEQLRRRRRGGELRQSGAVE